MNLGFEIRENESLRECIIRYAKPHGLERKCIKVFEMEAGRGKSEFLASMYALSDYDLLEVTPDDFDQCDWQD